MLELLAAIVPPLAWGRRPTLCVVLAALGAGAAAAHQDSPPPGQPRFASATNLVEVYATVTRGTELVTGLAQSDFQVFEDGVLQDIAAFAAGEVPLSVAIAVDRSFSMQQPRIDRAVRAAGEFVRRLRPGDAAMALAIGSEVEVLAPLTSDAGVVARAFDHLPAWGTTPLYDAALAAADAIQSAAGRRVLVLFTDGNDRYSTATAAAVREAARQRDVLVYAVALRATVPAVLSDLAASSGGRAFAADTDRELAEVVDRIARELRAQYVIGYTPQRPLGSGDWRTITVSVRRSGAQVRARDGYYAR